MTRSHLRWWLLSILLFSFLLRAWNLGGKSLWIDEAFAVWNAERTPAEILAETHDNHPPVYYLMLHEWIKVSEDEAWLRLPSLFASFLSLPLTFALGRFLFGEKTALTALILLAVAPLSVWYAQETWMFIFIAPFALLIALGLVRQGWQGGLLLFIGLAGGFYFNYAIVPLWVILSGLWLEFWWRNGRPRSQLIIWLLSSTAGWLASIPLWPHLALVIGRLSTIFVFANFRDQFGLPDLGGPVYLLGLIALGGAAFIASWLWRWLAKKPTIRPILTITIIGGFLLLTLLTPIPRLYSIKRVVVTGWPLVIFLVAMLFNWLKPTQQWIRPTTIILSLLAACTALLLIPKDDWRGAVTYINQHITPNDVVWLSPSSDQIPYNYYQPQTPGMIGLNLLDDPPTANIWHIAERQPGLPIPNGPIETWLDQNRPLLESIPFYRLEVRHYGPPTP
ncbi:MAG: glycosyltransferase family 39 protein [Candidatus Promineifilaceae bacterium]